MLGVGWLLHQPSHDFDDVSTPVLDMVLMIVIPSRIFESVRFPLPEGLIIWHASHELLDAIPAYAAWETQSGVFFLQYVVIVRLHALLLDPTLDTFVLVTRRKRRAGIVSYVRPKPALSVVFPWLSNVIDQQSGGSVVYFGPRWRWR